MKRLIIIFLFLSLGAFTQEQPLDPSIFDGTGKDREPVEPEKKGQGGPSSEEESEESAPLEEAAQAQSESEALPTAEPREIILPGSGEEKTGDGNAEEETPPGVPAVSGGSKSRAGETVNSTEKIAPGQAVDFPWDM